MLEREKMAIAFVALAAMLLVFSGCTGDGHGSARSPDQLRQRMTERSVICDGYQTSDEPGLADKKAVCTIEGVHVELLTFKDRTAVERWDSVARLSDCKGAGKPLNWVEGDNWVVTAGAEATARKLAGVLDAKLVRVDC